MMRLIRWMIHPLARAASLYLLKRACTSEPILYPTLVDLTFNREKYYKEYLDGKSYEEMLERRASNVTRSIRRSLYKQNRRAQLAEKNPEFYEELQIRWIKFCRYYNDKAEEQREQEEFEDAERAFNALK